MKKFILISMFLLLPYSVYASWYNPVSWFKQTLKENPEQTNLINQLRLQISTLENQLQEKSVCEPKIITKEVPVIKEVAQKCDCSVQVEAKSQELLTACKKGWQGLVNIYDAKIQERDGKWYDWVKSCYSNLGPAAIANINNALRLQEMNSNLESISNSLQSLDNYFTFH